MCRTFGITGITTELDTGEDSAGCPLFYFHILNKRKLLFSLNGFYRWSVAFLEKTGYPDGEVNSMNKERLGTFIAENRKAFGMTQKDLAETLHITDKAVSKWERGLSYPDVTLLEPLAAAFSLSVEELVACRKRETEEREEEPVRALLDISRDNLKRERRRGGRRSVVLGVLLITALMALALLYADTFVSEQREDAIILKETVNGENYLYVEEEGHLLKLKCGDGIDFDGLTLQNDFREPNVFRIDCRWNKRTYVGTVRSCEVTDRILLGLSGMVGSMMGLDTMGATGDQLFGYDCVFFEYINAYPNPNGNGELYSFRFWSCDPETWEKEKLLLTVDDCFGFAQTDYDHDGVTELAVRTRWAEKPYTVYDMVDGKVTETWPDTVDPELTSLLRTDYERQKDLEQGIR